jgi:hypothetical protein
VFKATKRTLTVAAAIMTASAPSAAYARFDLSPTAPPAVQTASVPAVQRQAFSQQGFQWDDAAIGGITMLALLGGGGAAVAVGRRRYGYTHQPVGDQPNRRTVGGGQLVPHKELPGELASEWQRIPNFKE